MTATVVAARLRELLDRVGHQGLRQGEAASNNHLTQQPAPRGLFYAQEAQCKT